LRIPSVQGTNREGQLRVEGGPSRIGGRLTGSEAAPGAPERAADFGASVATAIHHRAHRPSAQPRL